jgi:hypothetical protein
VPAREQWWNDAISSDIAYFYRSQEDAALAAEKALKGKSSKKGRRGTLIWGDRVRVLKSVAQTGVAQISARGYDDEQSEMWVKSADLGGEPLLELYVIDVGQGDGLLLVTPEGHHILVDGGDLRQNQQGGKNAADFIDWKFSRDYLGWEDRKNDNAKAIELDATIASHCDQDHFGGLLDLLDLTARAAARNPIE